MDRLPEYSVEWGEKLERDVDEYLETLELGLELSDLADGIDGPDTITGYQWCGCEDCWRREVFTFVMVRTLEGFLAGDVTFPEVR